MSLPRRRPWMPILVLVCALAFFLRAPVAAQTPKVVQLHSAQAGGSANGATMSVLGYDTVAVQNTIAAAWDGTLTFEVTTDNSNWTSVTCRNALSSTTGPTVVAAAGYMVCPVAGAQGFRARVSGRTVGTVTAIGIQLASSTSGVESPVPPVGAAATQVQGTAADGAAAVGNPVQVGGKDGAGNAQSLLTGMDGRADVNVGQIDGVTPLMGNGVTGTGSHRVTVASDNTPFPVKIDQTTPGTTNAVAVITGQNGIAGGTGVDGATVPRMSLATNVALPAGTNLLGKVGIDQTTPGTTNRVDIGTFPDNEPFNVAQINGVTPLMGNGVTGTGSQRVTIASDNTAFTVNIGTFPDNEPINVAQINGVTPLMGAGNTGTGSPRVTIAADQVVIPTKQAPGDAPCKTTTVNSQGVANAGVVVDATAGGVTVLAASATRCGAVLYNLQGGGDALCAPTTITVTTTVGFYLAAGQSLSLDDAAQQAWKCIRQAGTSATLYVAESTP